MPESFVAAAHAIIAAHPPETVHAESARRSAAVRDLSRQCEALPTDANRAALRLALDAAWPYTHASGMLKAQGR